MGTAETNPPARLPKGMKTARPAMATAFVPLPPLPLHRPSASSQRLELKSHSCCRRRQQSAPLSCTAPRALLPPPPFAVPPLRQLLRQPRHGWRGQHHRQWLYPSALRRQHLYCSS